MKVLYLFLLVAGPFCLQAQAWLPPVPGIPPVNGRPLQLEIPEFKLSDTALTRQLLLSGPTTVRVMAPDRMPCVVSDLSRVERMPVDRRGNADRMSTGHTHQ
jgi:hypothetical protein